MVGCSITRDRAFAAKFVESSDCRFCGNAKETRMHIVRECTALPEELNKPVLPQILGPNFDVFGIAEIPFDDAKSALQVSDFSHIPKI